MPANPACAALASAHMRESSEDFSQRFDSLFKLVVEKPAFIFDNHCPDCGARIEGMSGARAPISFVFPTSPALSTRKTLEVHAMPFTLPALPYAADSLEPHIDKQ